MAEAISQERGGSVEAARVAWGRAFIAGLVATVAITVSMALSGMNVMKSMGAMVLGAGAGTTTQYVVGGSIHLMVGLFYGFVYAALVAPVRRWGAALKGVIYGLAITAVALAAMPVMAAMMGGGGAANPCNPCAAKPQTDAGAKNPCNPCAAKKAGPAAPAGGAQAAGNPCAAKNPCNPCAAKTGATDGGQTATSRAGNPCGAGGNPCNPCGGGNSPYGGLVSLINHLVFGLALAFVYGRAA